MSHDDEIERRRKEFFGEDDFPGRSKKHAPVNSQSASEATKTCPSCRARISVNAIFCVHCSHSLNSTEIENDDKYSEITWGKDEAIFHHEGGQSSTYEEIKNGQDRQQQQSPKIQNYRCPQCRTDHIQSFPMAYRSGTGQANFSGSGYSIEAGNVSVSGTSHHQTQLAGMTAPPSRPKPFLLAIIATFVVPFFSLMPLFFAYLTSPAKFAFILLIDGALIAAAYVLCAFFAPPQRKRYREKYELWERAWICLRCGHSFYIK